MQKLPLETQTLYAEMMEQLIALEAQRSIGHVPGCFATKSVKGVSYYYFQYSDPGGTQRQVYVGKKSPELDRIAERYKAEREIFQADAAHILRLCAHLRVGGASITDTASARVLRSFAECGVFHLEGVLLGTHAFTALGNLLGVRWESSAIRTHDIDIGGEQSLSIALPNIQADIPKALERLEMGFLPVPPLDPKHPSTPFKVRGNPLRVDVLTTETRPGQNTPVFISRFNVAAQPLRFLDYLIDNPVKSAVINGGGILVTVPQPGKFAIHKLIISQERELTAHDKVEKDIMQAAQVISVLSDDRPGDLLMALDEIKLRGEGWVKRVEIGISKLKASYPLIHEKVDKLLG